MPSVLPDNVRERVLKEAAAKVLEWALRDGPKAWKWFRRWLRGDFGSRNVRSFVKGLVEEVLRVEEGKVLGGPTGADAKDAVWDALEASYPDMVDELDGIDLWRLNESAYREVKRGLRGQGA